MGAERRARRAARSHLRRRRVRADGRAQARASCASRASDERRGPRARQRRGPRPQARRARRRRHRRAGNARPGSPAPSRSSRRSHLDASASRYCGASLPVASTATCARRTRARRARRRCRPRPRGALERNHARRQALAAARERDDARGHPRHGTGGTRRGRRPWRRSRAASGCARQGRAPRIGVGHRARGHTVAQPPQPTHRCGSTLTWSPSALIAARRADVDALVAARLAASGCARRSSPCSRRTSASRTRRPAPRARRRLAPARADRRPARSSPAAAGACANNGARCRSSTRSKRSRARDVAALEVDRADGAAGGDAGAVRLARRGRPGSQVDRVLRDRRGCTRCSACRARGRSGSPAATRPRKRRASR